MKRIVVTLASVLVASQLAAQMHTQPGSGYTDRIRPFSEGQDVDHTPCRQNETGPQCQARLGADWEVIQSTDGKLAGERIACVINVNTATAAQLMLLPGVGKVLAGRIIAARPFASVAGVAHVKGIGHGVRLARLTPYVTVSGATTLTHKVGGVR